jgi:hypothetical protein
MTGGRRDLRSAGLVCAVAVCAIAVGVASGASRPVAYCNLTSGPTNPSWAFHVGAPITKPTGTYAHGRGTLSGQTASGKMCQVDRVRTGPDRQITLAVTHGGFTLQHATTVNGVIGNRLQVPVRVTNSTDPRCHVGAHGTVTIFASFNGVHKDSVRFAFPKSCARHRHDYSGPAVVALVPR